jgi:hypothetical protein
MIYVRRLGNLRIATKYDQQNNLPERIEKRIRNRAAA